MSDFKDYSSKILFVILLVMFPIVALLISKAIEVRVLTSVETNQPIEEE